MASAQSQLDLSRHKEAQKQAEYFAVNHTTSTLFGLAQPAHSRLFVPAQQNASLGLPAFPRSEFYFQIFCLLVPAQNQLAFVH